MNEDILSKIIEWGRKSPEVRALILEGSRAERDKSDELSDYDVNVFTTKSRPFTEDNSWLSSIGDSWICIPAVVERNSKTFPSRLVIFRNGVKADFILYPVSVLHEFAKADHLPDQYDIGYQVLLDKDGVTEGMKCPSYTAFKGKRPSADEFEEGISHFWFEAYHVATYLKRGDLWSVKFRDWECKKCLIKMIEWHENARQNWQVTTNPIGKHMKMWVGNDTWDALHEVFAHFESPDSWRALIAMTDLFRKIAIETSAVIGFPYNHELDMNISGFIQQLRNESV